jgi:hypothetical protein
MYYSASNLTKLGVKETKRRAKSHRRRWLFDAEILLVLGIGCCCWMYYFYNDIIWCTVNGTKGINNTAFGISHSGSWILN